MIDPIQTLKALEATITPGEWSIPHFAEPRAKCECGYIFGEGQGGMVFVCTVSFGGEYEPREVAAANGRFISAARNLMPELLALWEAVNIEGQRVKGLEQPCICPTCMAVRALNARAREVLK